MAASFDLVVRTPAGAIQALALQAADAAAARGLAAQRGLHVLTCNLHAGTAGRSARSHVRAGRQLDIANLSYELSSLMAAGLSVMESLRTLAAKERSSVRRSMLLEVVAGVNEGMTLSSALSRHPGRYPALLIATVSASEQTGDLSTALLRYSEHQQSVKALRDKVVGAAIYPMLLLGVGCLVVLFLLGVVVPKFAVLIESTRRELPWSSQLMMSWGRLAADNAWTVALCGLAALVAIALTLRQLARTGARSRWVESTPVIGPAMRRFRHAQLYRTTGMLVQGGIAAPRALELAASLLGDADQVRLKKAIVLIHEGRSISGALQDAELADHVASSMLTVAERTGALAEILQRIAQFHESTLQRSVEMTSRLCEPILMIVIGLVIGGIVVLMYLPIFDLAASLQ
jgi:general secretion pathway protein F